MLNRKLNFYVCSACPAYDLTAVSYSCTSYYKCTALTGAVTIQTCPAGMVFDDVKYDFVFLYILINYLTKLTLK
jgi:hypothetical protein